MLKIVTSARNESIAYDMKWTNTMSLKERSDDIRAMHLRTRYTHYKQFWYLGNYAAFVIWQSRETVVIKVYQLNTNPVTLLNSDKIFNVCNRMTPSLRTFRDGIGK